MDLPPILVCFAVGEEARAFEKVRKVRPRAKILLTGMGKRNAQESLMSALQLLRPVLVLTCGFAGGLNPAYSCGTIVFAGADEAMENALLGTGAVGARFHCADRVVSTSAEKRALRESTGADAVEMESQFITSICSESGIPVVTVRVVLDPADQDLPLDFNALMTSDQELSYWKLARQLWRTPRKIGELRELQKQSAAAARELALTLAKVIPV